MKTLYITGNGFDIHHGLNTRYADFHQFVIENDNELETLLDNFFDFKVDEKNRLWSNFENDLSSFDSAAYFNEINDVDITDDSFRPRDCFILEDNIVEESEDLVQKIRDGFVNWVETIEYPSVDQVRDKMIALYPDAHFLNFNYTDTLEEIYSVGKERILYIHNNANDRSGELIFGHGKQSDNDDEDEFDENGDSNRTMFTDAQNAARAPFYAFKKETEEVLKDNVDFFKKLKSVRNIIVLGHSLGEVDWPYFQVIAAVAKKAKWQISYFDDDELEFKKTLANAMLTDMKIEMIKIESLI